MLVDILDLAEKCRGDCEGKDMIIFRTTGGEAADRRRLSGDSTGSLCGCLNGLCEGMRTVPFFRFNVHFILRARRQV